MTRSSMLSPLSSLRELSPPSPCSVSASLSLLPRRTPASVAGSSPRRGVPDPLSSPSPRRPMEDEEMEKKVQQYLQRKGLRVTGLAPAQEDRGRLSASAGPHDVTLASLPYGYLRVLQNGYTSFLSPVPLASKQGLPEPPSDAISSCVASGSKPRPVINIDGGDDVRTEKRLPWKPDEDLRLVSAWLKCSNDPSSGNGKKNEQYWGDVLEFYNRNTPTNRIRKVKHLKDRFQKIKRWVAFFCASWKKATSLHASGHSDSQSNDDLRDIALNFYLEDYKEGPFTVIHCWKVLRDEPKWHALLEDFDKPNKRKFADEGDVSNSLSVPEDTDEKERLTGAREAKKQRNVKDNVKDDVCSLDEDMKKYMEFQAEARKRHEEFIEIQRRVSDAKVEAARIKREAAMLKTYKSFMCMDTREMSDEIKAEHLIGLKILREKLFGNTN
ncbi:hypothetical protein ACP4OV_014194 [Aristida adscensionis]